MYTLSKLNHRVPLLRYVSGLDTRKAESIVFHRNKHGPFHSRSDLMKVAGIGPKTFELAAGFLRIFEGSNPFDATGIHPESYDVAKKLLELLFQRSRVNDRLKDSDLIKESFRNDSPIRKAIIDEINRIQERPSEIKLVSAEVGISESDFKDLITEVKNGFALSPPRFQLPTEC